MGLYGISIDYNSFFVAISFLNLLDPFHDIIQSMNITESDVEEYF